MKTLLHSKDTNAKQKASRRRDGEPWLKLNSFGKWVICHSPGDGRTRNISCKTDDREKAEQQLAAFRRELSGEAEPAPGLACVQDVLDYYQQRHVEKKVNDEARRLLALRWLSHGLGSLPISRLSLDAQDDYLDGRRDGSLGVYPGYPSDTARTAGEGTLRYEMNTLTSAFRFALDRQRLEASQMPRINLPDAPDAAGIWLDEKEASWLLKFVEAEEPNAYRMTRMWRFVVLLLASGPRKSAALNLLWADVDRAEWKIHYQQADRAAGKQKSKKRTTVVPVPEWAQPLLQRAWEENQGSPWVLDHATDLESQFDKVRRDAFEATGNPKFRDMTIKTLRHTAATLRARGGASIWDIANLLGNSPMVCAKVYLHHCPDHLRAAANAWQPDLTVGDLL